jgi:integrase
VQRPTSGHVFRIEGKRRPVWYAKYRLPDGRQVQKRLGPAWTQRGRPPAGYFTKRTAEAWLRGTLDEARRGTLPGMVRTGATFADAAAEWLRYVEHERACKPSTLEDYRQMVRTLNGAFGDLAVESVTRQDLERLEGDDDGRARNLEPHTPEVPGRPERDLQAGDARLEPTAQSGGGGRAPAP